MNASKIFLSVITLLVFMVGANSYAALPISECKTFLDDELEVLCLKNSIEARIEDEIPFNFSIVKHAYSKDDIAFRSNRLISLSPTGTVNYDIHYAGFRNPSHLYNPFMTRVLDGEVLSYDAPETTIFEMKYFIEHGNAYVSIEKRRFNDNVLSLEDN